MPGLQATVFVLHSATDFEIMFYIQRFSYVLVVLPNGVLSWAQVLDLRVYLQLRFARALG